jgi:predicted Zn-dependent peptidase
MTRLGKSLVTDTELVSIDETIRRVDAVEPDDVAAAAAALFDPERLAAAGIGPRESRFRAALARLSPSLAERP